MKLLKHLKLEDPILMGASILAVGPAIGYAVGFLLFIFLTRIYTAEQFGYYNIYLSLTLILSTIISGKYDAAIVVSKTEKELVQMIQLALVCSLALCIVFTGAILFVLALANFIGFGIDGNTSQLLLFVPFSALLVGIYNILSSIALHNKTYSRISISEFQMKVGQIIFQLLIGLLFKTIYALMFGFMLSMLISILIIIKPILRREFLSLKQYDFKHLFSTAASNYTYPVLVGSGQLTNVLTQHLAMLFIGAIYTAKDVALYAVITKVFSTMNYLIGQTTNKVYFASVSNKLSSTDSADKFQYIKASFVNIFMKFFFAAAPIFLIIGLFGSDILHLVFQDTWIPEKTYMSSLITLYFFQLMSMPFGLFILALNKRSLFFYREFALLLLMVLLFLIAWQVKWNINTLIYYYGIIGALYYFMYILSSWSVILRANKTLLEEEANA